jgi:hypothetical protein
MPIRQAQLMGEEPGLELCRNCRFKPYLFPYWGLFTLQVGWLATTIYGFFVSLCRMNQGIN